MKKLYTIALAAAVGFTATAAPHHAIERTATLSKQSFAIHTANGEKLVKLTNNSDIHKAPTNAPASLDGRNFIFSYGLLNGSSYNNLSSQVEFEFIQTDEESGYDFYNMYGLLDGLFSNITPIEQIVAYSSATGELVLPVGQDIVIFAAQGGDKTLQSWNMINNSVYSDIDFYFDWNGSGFTWAPTQTFPTQTGNMTFTSTGMFVGTETEDNRVNGVFSIDDFSISPLNGQLTFTMAGDTGAETITSPLSVTVDGNKVNIGNFADMLTVPCTLDTEAKTLTAENVVFGQLNIGTDVKPVVVDAYMSEADNDANDGYAYNVYDPGVYKIVMHYTVANGKTTVNMPNWNVFYMQGGEDYDALPFITKSSMVFDFELGAATEGVSDIITDDSNAPVEYFNLQGVRVANPENGLYIRRQGNKAEKVLVK